LEHEQELEQELEQEQEQEQETQLLWQNSAWDASVVAAMLPQGRRAAQLWLLSLRLVLHLLL
jgi:hypothetical protein